MLFRASTRNQRSKEVGYLAQENGGYEELLEELLSKKTEKQIERWMVKFLDGIRFPGDTVSEAEDLTCEVINSALEALPDIVRGVYFRSWLHAIKINRAIDFLRSYRRRQEIRDTSSINQPIKTGGDYSSLGEFLEDRQFPLSRSLETRQEIAFFWSLCQENPEKWKPLLMVAGGLPYDKVAAILGMKVGAVRTKVCRLRGEVLARQALERNTP